jgi:large subunit ribosomal protein L10
MSKYVKELIQGELEQRVADGDVKEFIVFNLMGVPGVETNVMRGELKQKGVEVFVVKNSLFRRALRNKNMESACDLFNGPCAVAYGGDSIVDAAKELVDWAKKVKAVQFKGAFLDGAILDGDAAKALATMPTRRELQGQIAACIMSPASQIAGALVGPSSKIAGCVKTIIEKAEEKEAA